MSTNMLTLLLTNQTFERGYQTLTFSVGKPRKTNNGMCYVVYGLIPTSVIWDLISRVKLNSQLVGLLCFTSDVKSRVTRVAIN